MQQHSRLYRNVSAEAGARLLYLATRFFIPPFVLARIGIEAYGLYGTVFVLVAYFGMSAIGFSSAYVKYVAEFSATDRRDELNSLLSSGFTLMTGIAVAGFGAFAFSWRLVEKWMKVPAALGSDARFLSFTIVGVFLAYLAMSVFRDVLTGLQEIGLTQRVWIASFVLETILIFALVGAGLGLRGMGIAFFARTLFDVGAHYLVARKRINWLRVRLVIPDRHSLRKLLSFGAVVQVNSMLAIFLGSVERVIATPVLGLAASGLLDLGKRFPSMATSIPSAFASSVYPSAADGHARGCANARREQLRSLYQATTRLMNAISGLLFAFLAFAAAPCLAFWLGHEVPAGAATLTVLFSLGLQLHQLTGPGTSILKASGRPNMEFHYSLPNCIALLVLVPASRFLLGSWTVTGVASACTVSTAVSAIWFLHRAHRELGVGTREFWTNTVLPGLVPYAIAAISLGPFADYAVAGGRLHTAAVLIPLGLAYVGLTLAALYGTCATKAERLALRQAAAERIGNSTIGSWLVPDVTNRNTPCPDLS